jgi:cell division septal protein FtsQ
VRITLVEREAEARKQRQRGKKRTRYWGFEAAIAQPQVQARPQAKKRRAPAKRSTTRPQPRAKKREAEVASSLRVAGRRRIVLARLCALSVLAASIGFAIYGSVDARFFVYQAQVSGARHVKADTIYQQAGVHEQNIFWIQPSEVAERILQIDGIKVAHVRCGLPASVSIEVEEREPVVMWRAQAQQRDWWLDEEGRVLPYPGDAQSPEMIFVVDSSQRSLEPKQSLQPAGLVRSVQQLTAALPGTQIFFYDGKRELSFIQKAGEDQWPVYIGTSDDLPRKIQVLQVLARYLLDNNIHPRYVDVRWADHPSYNVLGGSAAGESE